MKLKLDKEYIKIGIVAFLVIAASIAVYFAFERYDSLTGVLSTITDTLGPFIYGLVIAYLLGPIYNLTYRKMIGSYRLEKLFKGKHKMMSKIVSSTVAILTMTAIIIGLLWMVVPSLIESITGIIKTMPSKINELSTWANDLLKNAPRRSGNMAGIVEKAIDTARVWVNDTMLPQSQTLIQGVSNGILGVVAGIKNFAIGIIICVFFLNSKEIFAAQTKKIIFVMMDKDNAIKFLQGAKFVNRTFGQFINGKLIDSLIIGIICFVFMSIVDWPFKVLISVIIGVTNIIPFFGPFIGAIPSTLLIFIESPITSLYFLIFVFALQQLDGNVIGPKILGESTGLPSFWVMFAILVGGGLFGFVGMVIGIPVFACIYAYTSYNINNRLTKKGLTRDLSVYKQIGIELEEKIDELIKASNK